PLAITPTGGNHQRCHPAAAAPGRDPRASVARTDGSDDRPRMLFPDRGCDHDKYHRALLHRGITPRTARHGATHGPRLGKTR
ncbi:IS5/IS1182 family transposase, partial [Streptomyces sp. NPDC088748]